MGSFWVPISADVLFTGWSWLVILFAGWSWLVILSIKLVDPLQMTMVYDQLRRWYRKLCCFHKIYNKESPGYLTELIPTRNEAYQTRHPANIPSLSFKHNFFKNIFFPSSILEWNKLDSSLRNWTSYNVFKNGILKFIRPSPNKIFQCHNPKGIKLVTRLRLGLSHLREHKFKHSFQGTLNPLCSCGVDIETTSPYFLHCPLFHAERSSLLNNINEIDFTIFNKSDSVVARILLYGNESFKDEVNLLILKATIDFVLFFEFTGDFILFIFPWLQLIQLLEF